MRTPFIIATLTLSVLAACGPEDAAARRARAAGGGHPGTGPQRQGHHPALRRLELDPARRGSTPSSRRRLPRLRA